MLIWCLKQLKNFILKFSIRGGFFLQKAFLNSYIVILVYFPSSGCVDNVVSHSANYHGYKDDVYLLQCYT